MPFQRVTQRRLEVAYAVPTPAFAPWVHRGSMPGLPKAIRLPRSFAMRSYSLDLINVPLRYLSPRNFAPRMIDFHQPTPEASMGKQGATVSLMNTPLFYFSISLYHTL